MRKMVDLPQKKSIFGMNSLNSRPTKAKKAAPKKKRSKDDIDIGSLLQITSSPATGPGLPSFNLRAFGNLVDDEASEGEDSDENLKQC